MNVIEDKYEPAGHEYVPLATPTPGIPCGPVDPVGPAGPVSPFGPTSEANHYASDPVNPFALATSNADLPVGP